MIFQKTRAQTTLQLQVVELYVNLTPTQVRLSQTNSRTFVPLILMIDVYVSYSYHLYSLFRSCPDGVLQFFSCFSSGGQTWTKHTAWTNAWPKQSKFFFVEIKIIEVRSQNSHVSDLQETFHAHQHMSQLCVFSNCTHQLELWAFISTHQNTPEYLWRPMTFCVYLKYIKAYNSIVSCTRNWNLNH